MGNNTLYAVGSVSGTSVSLGNLAVPLVTANVNNWVGLVAEISGVALPVRTATTLATDALYPNPASGSVTVRVPAADNPYPV